MKQGRTSRRSFVKHTVAAASGIAGSSLALDAALAQVPTSVADLPEPPRSSHPSLNRRTLGWLRFLWDKATTADDWSSSGVPHPWWDRYTAPVVLSYGRFDLSYSAYGCC